MHGVVVSTASVPYIPGLPVAVRMFEPTIPFGEPELLSVSAFRRYLDELTTSVQPHHIPSSRLAALSPSLLADLMRFEDPAGATEVLEVLAACMRHARDVTVHLGWGEKVAPLTLFPHHRLVHSPVAMDALLATRPSELHVMLVEPATLRPPGDPETSLVAPAAELQPLGLLLWELALRGRRDSLLPEIEGPAAYRLAPGVDLSTIRPSGAIAAALERMQAEPTTLREMSDWPGFDRERASRLLNAIYLQSGLIISRAHPAAINDSWFGMLPR